jgi:hypothetical protein
MLSEVIAKVGAGRLSADLMAFAARFGQCDEILRIVDT